MTFWIIASILLLLMLVALGASVFYLYRQKFLNEMQNDFWVMKLTDSTTAVKVPIKKGIESGNKVEIISPQFSVADEILLTGNYGLADTAKVKVIQ